MEEREKNYYEVLEVPIDASMDEIQHGYIRAKNAYSTDSLALYSLMSQDECDNILEIIEEAYIIVSDPEKRRRYDYIRGFNQNRETETVVSAHNTAQRKAKSNEKKTWNYTRNMPHWITHNLLLTDNQGRTGFWR